MLNLLWLRHDGEERDLTGACIFANLGATLFLVFLAGVEPVHVGNPTYLGLAVGLSVLSLAGR